VTFPYYRSNCNMILGAVCFWVLLQKVEEMFGNFFSCENLTHCSIVWKHLSYDQLCDEYAGASIL